MGPITLFDKSFLQSLRIQESVWFDQYSLANVCPMFYAETLADLGKKGRRGKTAAEEVRIIADKFPEMNSVPCAYHVELVYADLIGYSVPMTGQVPVSEGEAVELDGRPAVRAPQSAVADAFARWGKGAFLEIEQRYAADWRSHLAAADLNRAGDMLRSVGIDDAGCSTLDDAAVRAHEFAKRLARESLEMDETLGWLGIPAEARPKIYQMWAESPLASLVDYAPYAAFVLKVDTFFRLALASSLISAERPSNRIDIAYLYYLPFCMVFVSGDKLHRRCAEFFLRPNQDFVWGPDLKAGLKWINEYFRALPEAEQLQGVMVLGQTLPPGAPPLMERLWDRHLPGWREAEGTSRKRNSDDPMEQIRKMKQAAPMATSPASYDSAAVAAATISRRVRRVKGGWHQVPHDTP